MAYYGRSSKEMDRMAELVAHQQKTSHDSAMSQANAYLDQQKRAEAEKGNPLMGLIEGGIMGGLAGGPAGALLGAAAGGIGHRQLDAHPEMTPLMMAAASRYGQSQDSTDPGTNNMAGPGSYTGGTGGSGGYGGMGHAATGPDLGSSTSAVTAGGGSGLDFSGDAGQGYSVSTPPGAGYSSPLAGARLPADNPWDSPLTPDLEDWHNAPQYSVSVGTPRIGRR